MQGNINSGVPRNTVEAYAADLDVYQINAENKLGHDSLRDVFPQDSRSIPISVIFWSVAFCLFVYVLADELAELLRWCRRSRCWVH